MNSLRIFEILTEVHKGPDIKYPYLSLSLSTSVCVISLWKKMEQNRA
jgi:hypothetical protein